MGNLTSEQTSPYYPFTRFLDSPVIVCKKISQQWASLQRTIINSRATFVTRTAKLCARQRAKQEKQEDITTHAKYIFRFHHEHYKTV